MEADPLKVTISILSSGIATLEGSKGENEALSIFKKIIVDGLGISWLDIK